MPFNTIFMRAFIAFALLFAANPSFSQDKECALEAIRTLRLGAGFQILSQQVAKSTTTYRVLQNKLGQLKADELMNAELAASIQKYQDQWDRNLAQAWGALMTCEELTSLASLKQQSSYSRKFMSLNNQAAAAMQNQSQPLLNTAVSEALTRAFTQSQSGTALNN